MKNKFALPDFKMTMAKRKPEAKSGKEGREIIKIEGKEMVVPNTFEPEKWNLDSTQVLQDLPPKVPVQVKIEQIKNS